MKMLSYVVNDELGLHARPAGLLVKSISAYVSTVTITKGDKSADGKRLFGVMGLGVKKGDEITITFDGADEQDAHDAVRDFLNANL